MLSRCTRPLRTLPAQEGLKPVQSLVLALAGGGRHQPTRFRNVPASGSDSEMYASSSTHEGSKRQAAQPFLFVGGGHHQPKRVRNRTWRPLSSATSVGRHQPRRARNILAMACSRRPRVVISPGGVETPSGHRSCSGSTSLVIGPGGFETTAPAPGAVGASPSSSAYEGSKQVVEGQLVPESAESSSAQEGSKQLLAKPPHQFIHRRHQPRRARNVAWTVRQALVSSVVISPGGFETGGWRRSGRRGRSSSSAHEGSKPVVALRHRPVLKVSSSAQEGSKQQLLTVLVLRLHRRHQPRRVHNATISASVLPEYSGRHRPRRARNMGQPMSCSRRIACRHQPKKVRNTMPPGMASTPMSVVISPRGLATWFSPRRAGPASGRHQPRRNRNVAWRVRRALASWCHQPRRARNSGGTALSAVWTPPVSSSAQEGSKRQMPAGRRHDDGGRHQPRRNRNMARSTATEQRGRHQPKRVRNEHLLPL